MQRTRAKKLHLSLELYFVYFFLIESYKKFRLMMYKHSPLKASIKIFSLRLSHSNALLMVSVIESLFTQNQTLVSFSMLNIHCHEKKGSENILFEHRAQNKGIRTLLSAVSTAPIPKLSYMMMNIRLLSLPLVCFVMNLRLLLIFIHIHVKRAPLA